MMALAFFCGWCAGVATAALAVDLLLRWTGEVGRAVD